MTKRMLMSLAGVAIAAIVLTAAAGLSTMACAGRGTETTQPPPSTSGPTTSAVPTSTTSSSTTTTVPVTTSSTTTSTTSTTEVSLSARQMAGQRVIYSYSGTTPPAALLALIRRGEVGGIIFFKENYSSANQFRSAVMAIETAAASDQNPVRVRLLLMTDQEGGQIRHLPGQPSLSQKQIGLSDDPAAAAGAAGAAAGRNLSGTGLNVNLAPVLDVYRAANDFSDHYGRSYSKDPEVVSELGAAFIKGQQDGGVLATVKHFPGLGAATLSQNTDQRAVTLNVPQKTLLDIDEYPYKAAIAAGVRLVMLSWAIYPALDPGQPAGFSSAIVNGELRERLGFEGVTITDAISAGAIQRFGTVQHRAVLAARAGMDLVLCSSRNIADGVQAVDGLERTYLNGSLDKAAFQEALNRVLDLREGLAG